ncbi:MAG: hypothetical protein J0I47_14590 [Sphingomonas sp.]|uniref:hypothetical protein n=1 Tax=Sphingomonas sp. TaxID=28214 RepID=UPI001ACE5BB9|nr:hypothetical protein [Sphingomonas sp.]MBN8809445.1 hypothetical protein [Sphingomonas sp.]
MLDQEAQQAATQQLREFVDKYSGMRIQSTSAKVVTYTNGLYNVDGSTWDPKIDGKNWKPLLEFYGIGGNCYVTSPLPTKPSSHPGFNVGGHMTQNDKGSVPTGGQCYLMPLCSWHNGKANDGVLFSHTQTKMLQLSGYMQGEAVATFLARLPSDAPLSLVFLDEDGLSYRNIADEPGAAAQTLAADDGPSTADSGPYVLLRQHIDGDTVTYTIEDSQF